jgi:hypothetical protein
MKRRMARVYTPPLQATLIRSGLALGQLWREYLRETSGALAAIAWAAVLAYFLSEAFKPSQRRLWRSLVPSRPKRGSGGAIFWMVGEPGSPRAETCAN